MAKKRVDGRYQVSKMINGKRKYFYGTTKKAAIAERDAYVESLAQCANYDNTITIERWCEYWIRLKKDTVSQNTLSSYQYIIKTYIVPFIGSIRLVELSALNVRALINNMGHLSARTISYTLTVLRAILKQAVMDEIISKNVATLVKKPKQERKREMVTLSKEEVETFLEQIDDVEWHALFKLAFTTGLRRSEILGLTWDDVNLKQKTLTVNQTVLRIDEVTTVSKTTKNSSSRRSISLDDKTIVELLKLRTHVDKRRLKATNWRNNNLVFPGKFGDPRDPAKVSLKCKKFATAIGRPDFTMHDTRHTHATLLLEAGVNFKVVQMRLGHSSYQQTMDTYSHVTPIMEADVVEKISNIF